MLGLASHRVEDQRLFLTSSLLRLPEKLITRQGDREPGQRFQSPETSSFLSWTIQVSGRSVKHLGCESQCLTESWMRMNRVNNIAD